VLRCVAVCPDLTEINEIPHSAALHCVAVRRSTLQRVAGCCRVLQANLTPHCLALRELQCTTVLTPACCSVLQFNAMCFCALQCAAVEERNTHTGVVPDIFLIRRSKGNPALNMGKSKVYISISSRQHPIFHLQFMTDILFSTHLVAAGPYPPHENLAPKLRIPPTIHDTGRVRDTHRVRDVYSSCRYV